MQGLNRWTEWSRLLDRWGMKEPVAIFMDSAGPLNIVLAQFVYLIQPFAQGFFSREESNSLAELLEDRTQRQNFIALLRQESMGG